MCPEQPLPVDRFLEMAEKAGRVRKALDSEPSVDARQVLVGVRNAAVVVSGFVRRDGDAESIRKIAEHASEGKVLDEIVVAVGRSPRVDLPDAELLLPSPEASRIRPDTAGR